MVHVVVHKTCLCFASFALLSIDTSWFRGWVQLSRYPWATKNYLSRRWCLEYLWTTEICAGWGCFFVLVCFLGFQNLNYRIQMHCFSSWWDRAFFKCVGHSSCFFAQFLISARFFYLNAWALELTVPVTSDYRRSVLRELIYLVSPVCRPNPFSLSYCTL